MKTLRQIYFVAWALLLSLFALLTVPKLINNLRSSHILPMSPTASIDSLLESTLEIRQPSAVLTASAAKIPAPQTIVFLSRKNDSRCDFVYSVLCYLTWPRKIDKVELAPNDPSPASAPAYVCGIADATAHTRTLGRHLTLRAP